MLRRLLFKLTLLATVAFYTTNVDRSVCAQSTGSRSTSTAVVTIRPTSTVDGHLLVLSDIARVESSDNGLKSLLGSLDIADLPASGESLVVRRSLIEFRLRLAGFDTHRVTIRGDRAEVTQRDIVEGELRLPEGPAGDVVLTKAVARNPNPAASSRSRVQTAKDSRGNASIQTSQNEGRSCEEIIMDVARTCVLKQLPWSEEAISIRLAQSIKRELEAIESAKSSVFTAELTSAGPAVGRVHVEVTVEGRDHTVNKVPVILDVRHYDDVVAAKKPIPRGRQIQQDDLFVHRWDVTGSADYYSDSQKLIGTTARHPIAALQIIRDQDVETSGSAPANSNPVVIKRQDRVKMIARIGDLTITASGEAQQDGRVGEMIRVQNVESKSIVQGRVVRASEVEIAD